MNAFNHHAYNDKYKTFIPAFEEMFQYSCKNYPFCIQQAAASNYALDVVDFYLFHPKVYSFFIKLRYKAYLLKTKLKLFL